MLLIDSEIDFENLINITIQYSVHFKGISRYSKGILKVF